MPERKRIIFDDDISGPEWVVTYLLDFDEVDDNIDQDQNTVEIIMSAEDFSQAVKYAEQYLRKKINEDSQTWGNAQILSVQLR